MEYGAFQMRVRSKPVEYEAFQMTRERCLSTADWPSWLLSEVDLDGVEPLVQGSKYSWRRQAGKDMWYLPIDAGFLTPALDDWVLRDPNGTLSVLTPAEFAELEVIEA